MKTLARCALVLSLTAMLVVTLGGLASAGQLIEYSGVTSQEDGMGFTVLKRDSGRRFLRRFHISFTTTCEDATTNDFSLQFGGQRRLGEQGEFQRHFVRSGEPFSYAFHVDGAVRFIRANGTFEFSYASFTEDEQLQLCTTGELDWSASRQPVFDRGGSPSVRPVSAHDGVTISED